MSKYITLCFIGILLSIQLFSQQLSQTIYFEKGSKHLKENEKIKLNNWINTLNADDIESISLEGFCDADGDDEFNFKLAHSRNEETSLLFPNNYKSLITQSSSIGEVGLETELETIKKTNRKVVITINQKSKKSVGVNQELTTLWKELKPKSQQFCIDPTRDTVLVLNEGSIITIGSYSFEQNNKLITQSDDCLFLIVDEVLSKKDSYLNSLTTQSNSATIESAGMLNISAEYKGSEANLIKEKDLLVMLPTQQTSVGDYQMFTGDRDPHSNEMNWLTDNNPELKNISMNDYFSCGGIAGSGNGGMYCKFFFCKIKRFFFPKRYNSGKRSYQPSSELTDINTACGNLIELYKKYGVDNYSDLQFKMNEALMKKYDVDNLSDLKVAMKKERIKKMENKFTNGQASFDDLRFMVYNTNNLGWANCDAFSNVLAINKTQLGVGMDDMKNVDVKLVFQKRNIILSPTLIGDKFYFESVPKNEKVIILAVKMQNNQPQVFMEERIIGTEDVTAKFESVTIDQLKNKLSVLDI
jgi:hypothetical protein